MAVIDDPGDVGLDERAAELLVVDHLADRRLHEVGAGEEDRARPLDDVRLVAHDRQVRSPRHARAEDRRHLEDAGRREPGVVVEDPAVMLAVGEDLLLERQEDAGRVDEIDDRQPVERLLQAQYLLIPIGNLRLPIEASSATTITSRRGPILPPPRRPARSPPRTSPAGPEETLLQDALRPAPGGELPLPCSRASAFALPRRRIASSAASLDLPPPVPPGARRLIPSETRSAPRPPPFVRPILRCCARLTGRVRTGAGALAVEESAPAGAPEGEAWRACSASAGHVQAARPERGHSARAAARAGGVAGPLAATAA